MAFKRTSLEDANEMQDLEVVPKFVGHGVYKRGIFLEGLCEGVSWRLGMNLCTRPKNFTKACGIDILVGSPEKDNTIAIIQISTLGF